MDDGFADTNFARRVEVPTTITKRVSQAEIFALAITRGESAHTAMALYADRV